MGNKSCYVIKGCLKLALQPRTLQELANALLAERGRIPQYVASWIAGLLHAEELTAGIPGTNVYKRFEALTMICNSNGNDTK